MAVRSVVSSGGREVSILVDGRFDFSSHHEFREAYSKVDPLKAQYVIDLSRAQYIDSSALGMLLLLRERAGGDKARIKITGCSPEIWQILEVSRFQKLFHIDCKSVQN